MNERYKHAYLRRKGFVLPELSNFKMSMTLIYTHSDTNFQWSMHSHTFFKKKKINTWNKQPCKYYQKFLKLRFLM